MTSDTTVCCKSKTVSDTVFLIELQMSDSNFKKFLFELPNQNSKIRRYRIDTLDSYWLVEVAYDHELSTCSTAIEFPLTRESRLITKVHGTRIHPHKLGQECVARNVGIDGKFKVKITLVKT